MLVCSCWKERKWEENKGARKKQAAGGTEKQRDDRSLAFTARGRTLTRAGSLGWWNLTSAPRPWSQLDFFPSISMAVSLQAALQFFYINRNPSTGSCHLLLFEMDFPCYQVCDDSPDTHSSAPFTWQATLLLASLVRDQDSVPSLPLDIRCHEVKYSALGFQPMETPWAMVGILTGSTLSLDKSLLLCRSPFPRSPLLLICPLPQHWGSGWSWMGPSPFSEHDFSRFNLFPLWSHWAFSLQKRLIH